MTKQRKGFKPDNTYGVPESTHIRVSQIMEHFLSSNDQVYTFEASLTKDERAVVHRLCGKMGMWSKNTGKRSRRRLSLYKVKKKSDTMDGMENAGSVTFSEESRKVLTGLFIHYPPGDDEAVKQNLNDPAGHTSKPWRRRDDIFRKPLLKAAEMAKKMETLASKIKQIPSLSGISEKRLKLPIASFQDVITSTVAAHQVVLISGETGCGKTTQVPQYLLDYMWSKSETCKIVCTQPRRISAISVAERISQERGEKVGESVGYKIRLDTKGGRHSSILFCTNGVLLRMLISSGAKGYQSGTPSTSQKDISDLTHIIVDEIHERDRYTDFMLAILRDLLPSYPHLHLVLMSATMDAERFSQYFSGCPIIRVPGFTHPVTSFYLEEILSILKSPEKNHLNGFPSCPVEELKSTKESQIALDEAIEMACSNEEFDTLLELISSEGTTNGLNYQHSLIGITPLMVFAGKGRVGDVCTLLSLGANCHIQARDGRRALDWAMQADETEVAEVLKKHMDCSSSSSVEEQQLAEKYMSNINPEFVDVVLVEKLLRKICTESQEGAILVFLPGWEDINRIREGLLSNPFFKNLSKFLILSLHSMVPATEQKKVFKQPPPGSRKIILSTNIAETAITIDDVVYVVDSGRMKEKCYDPHTKFSTLQTCWISQASAKQREGRAGRCQPGVCYHLYSKLLAVSLPDFQVPEIKRIPVEELCLQVKMFDPSCKVEEFLQKTLDPPLFKTIQNAITVLQEIGAFSNDEKLTEMGEKLGSLPVHPVISKMLFFAILLNCLDPALTLACASDYRDPFTLPMLPNDRKRAAAAKAELASLYGGYSDQLAAIAAFDCWKSAKERGQESQFCSEYFVSANAMYILSGMRKQLQNELAKSGFIPDDASSCSMNARDPGIVRAVILAGLYPMVGRLHPAKKSGRRLTVETASGGRVCLHPHSLNSKLSFKRTDGRPLLVYDEVTRCDGGLHTRKCTLIGPLFLLLIANEIVVAPGKNSDDADDEGGDSGSAATGDEDRDDVEEMKDIGKTDKQGERIMSSDSSPDNAVIIVDRWLSFKSTALEMGQINCLKERLSAAILFKVINPRDALPPALGASIYATACLLADDGLSGITSFVESIATSTSMANNTKVGKLSTDKQKAETNPGSFLKSLVKHDNRRRHGSSRPYKGNMDVSHGNSHPVRSTLLPSQSVPTPEPAFPPAEARPTQGTGIPFTDFKSDMTRPGLYTTQRTLLPH